MTSRSQKSGKDNPWRTVSYGKVQGGFPRAKKPVKKKKAKTSNERIDEAVRKAGAATKYQ